MNGIGMWIWMFSECGGPEWAADLVLSIGAKRALIKVSDGTKPFKNLRDLDRFRARLPADFALGVWGYQYPDASAQAQAEALCGPARDIGAGLVIANCEIHHKGHSDALHALLTETYESKPGEALVGLSSFKFPRLHGGAKAFPWDAAADFPDLVGMPQVYLWGSAANAGAQVNRAVNEWRAICASVEVSIGAWRPRNNKKLPDHSPEGIVNAVSAIADLAQRGACSPVADAWALDQINDEPVKFAALQGLRSALPCSMGTGYEVPLSSPWYQQAALARLGHRPGTLSDAWTPAGTKALRAFQSKSAEYQRLRGKIDGVWGTKSERAVRVALAML